jgi:CubicO group peptidase (beta-lactamase class C family)
MNISRVCFFVALWSIATPCWASDPFEKVREDIRRSLERDSVPSLAVAVAKEGKIIWEEGFGWANKEQKVESTAHTPYSIASISKPVTATSLMVLVQRGLIKLDQPANEILGDAKLTAHLGQAEDATVRRIANHTSGLPLHYQFFYADDSYQKPEMTESIRRYGHLLCPPGEEFQYANFGYGLLDYMVALKSHRSFAEFVRDEVFLPLGMTQSSIGIPAGLESKTAARYAQDGSPLPFYDFDHPGGSAVFSSAHDLALFGLFHSRQKQEEQKSILNDESLGEMQRGTADCGEGRRYGVGWFVNDSEFGYRTISHTGGMGGVRCRLVMVPDKQIVVVTLCNASNDLPLRIAREILGELLPDYGVAMRKNPEHKVNSDSHKPYAPPELVGFWQGKVETYAGNRNVQMWVQPDGDVKIRVGGGLVALLNRSNLHDGLLTGEFVGDIGTDDANRRRYHLHVRAKLRGEKLNGALTAMSLPARKAGNALSHWLELTRQDPDPDILSLFNGHDLDGWKVADQIDFERHGRVEVINGELVLNQGKPATGIAFSGSPPRMNYEISLEAKRIEGSDFFCGLTFPVAESYLSFILGGWGGGVTGLSNLDGASAVENETTGYREFEPNRWYAIRLRVTPGKVQIWLDGEQLIDVETTDRKLSIWWEQEPMRPLGIASWNTKAALRNIRLKRL